MVSDYRYRGVPLSNGNPALQGSLDVETEAGLHARLWASAINGGGNGRIELDASAGYALELGKDVSFDFGGILYAYPNHRSADALELTACLEATHGPWTATIGASLAPPQGGTTDDSGRKRRNAYAAAILSHTLEALPLTLRASAGFEDGAWDLRSQGGKIDWTVGADLEFGAARFSVEGTGSNASHQTMVGSLFLTF